MAKQSKSIDLGALQEGFESARREFAASAKALERAQQDYDIKAARLADATAALKASARAVLG